MLTNQLKKVSRVLVNLTIVGMVVCSVYPASALDLEIKKVKGVEYYYYKVKKGDTLYGLSQSMGLTQPEIIKYNPQVADGLKSGMKLYFPVSDFKFDTMPSSMPVVFGETETTANFAGNVGSIEFQEEVTPVNESSMRLRSGSTAGRFSNTGGNSLKVAVCMPFMLDDTKANKTATYATDFYRGFLLGVDSLRKNFNNPNLEIIAVDCGNEQLSLNKLAETNASLKTADIIIAPDVPARLAELGTYGLDNRIYIFNAFQPRDTTYMVNPYMMQGNIPTNDMYQKVIDYFIDNIDGSTIVFLENTTSKKNKKEFVDALKARLDSKKIDYNTMTYETALTATAISNKFDAGDAKYIFVPLDASVEEFNKFAAALTNFKSKFNADDKGGFWLFGYPEYTVYKGDTLSKLKKLDTRYYSRFITDTSMPGIKAINSLYNDRFGSNLPAGVPNQALYGFDVAHWIISLAARNNARDNLVEVKEETGAQTAYHFVAVPGGGFVNNAVIIVKLAPDTDTKIEIL